MKKLFLLLLFAALGLHQLQAQQTLVLANDGTISTSNSGRAPQGSRLCSRSVYLITQSEMQASGFNFGDLISQIGFNYSNAQNTPTTSSTFELYLQNSFDVTYSKTSVWDTAITDMTQVRNTNITIPATTGIFTIPFTGSSSFIYTGGSIYVAFDYQNLINSTSSSNRALCTTSLSSGIKTFVSNSTVGSNLSNSSQRPETYFTKGCTFVTPTFNTVAPIATGASLSPLPTTSNNGITGTWSPVLNNLTTTTYTFTPTYALLEGQCLTSTTMTITVIPLTPPGNALNFNGSNDYVNCGNNSSVQLTQGTIEAWIKTQNAGSSYRGIVVKQSAYGLFLTDNVLQVYIWGSANPIINTGINLADNRWHHVAFSFNSGVNNGSVIYVDGVAKVTFTYTVNNQGQELCIGAGQVSPLNQNFAGTIDEVRVWNILRTAQQIQSNMLTTMNPTSTGLVAYYNFDNGTASGTNTGLNTLVNQTGNTNNNGTLYNFALSGATRNWVESYAMVVPTANAATSIGSTGFTASWTAPAVGSVDNLYVLSVSASPNFDPPTTNYQISPSATSFEITGLNPGTTYYYKVRADKTSVTGQGGFSSTITVCTSSTVTSASSSPTLCINSALTAITHTTAGATGIGTASNLPTGVTASWSNNTITISGTPSVSGTFNYSIPLTVGCGSAVNATGTIIVNPEVTPTFDAVAPITIGASLPVLPTISNNGITGTWSPDLDTNTIATTTYTFTPTAGQCATTTTMNITVLQPASSLHFSQTNNMVALGQTLGNFGTGDFAIEMKVKTQQSSGYLLAKRSFCDADNFLSMSINPEGKIFVETYNFSIANNFLNGNVTIADNTWHHITLTRTGGYLKLYVDGVLDTISATNTAVDLNSNYTIHLGGAPCDNFNGSSSNYFNGNMDEVRFWNRSLTQGEIQNNMNCEVQSTGNGLLANYHFNEGNVNANNSGVATLTDSSGNNNTGTLINFDLTGTTSNWSNAAAVTSGVSCAPYTVLYTAIPDAQFESYLWNQGYDDIQGDGKVPTANISTITNLQISWWNISDLTGIQDFSSLIALKCRGNNLSTLNLSGLQNLNNIDCALNQLTSITLNNLPSLAIVEADNNFVLQNIDLIGLPSLSTLVIQNNALTSLNFIGAPNLTGINCGSNPLTTLDVQSLTNLQVLYCAATQISSLNLVGLNDLNTMACNANPNLTCITVSNPASAAANGNWQKDATANYSTNCNAQPYTAIPDVNFEQALFDLGIDTVNGDHQVLTSAISGITSLDVSTKNITNLTGIKDFTSLTELFCYSNQLTTLDVSNMTTLSTLYCSNNQLTSLNVSGDVSLTTLGCHVNQLTTLQLSGLTSLTTLYSQNNQLSNLNFSGLSALHYAACNSNLLSELDLSVIPQLTELYCDDNQLLTSLNLSGLSNVAFVACHNNISLTCITTSDPNTAAFNPNWVKDATANYATNCGIVIPTTKVKSNLCGATLSSLSANINADYVAGYQAYRFEVTNGTTVNTVEVNKYNFSLTQTPGITYGTTYGVRVAIKMGGNWGAYGDSCNVTTPVLTLNVIPTTTIMPSFCGTTLAALDTKISATPVSAASGYRFEVTSDSGTDNELTMIYNSPTYNFKLSQSGTIVAYGKTYIIRVAALVDGVYGNYGAYCNVSTPVLAVNTVPTTTIQPSFCGTTLAALDTKIGAVIVAGATKGRFEVTIAGGSPVVYEVAAYNFKLSQTGVAVLYSTSYSIRVAAFVGGVWGNYGSACTVTTPAAPGARLKAKSFEVSAYPNPFETAFNLNIETPSKEEVTIAVYDMMGKLVETHQVNPTEVANLQIGNNFAAGIYNVIVSQANEMQAIRLIRK